MADLVRTIVNANPLSLQINLTYVFVMEATNEFPGLYYVYDNNANVNYFPKSIFFPWYSHSFRSIIGLNDN